VTATPDLEEGPPVPSSDDQTLRDQLAAIAVGLRAAAAAAVDGTTGGTVRMVKMEGQAEGVEQVVTLLECRAADDAAPRDLVPMTTTTRSPAAVTVVVPIVGNKGPGRTDAQVYHAAAERAACGYPVGGSNTGDAVALLLRRVARALENGGRS
jgi:hypothetical protein